MEGTVIRFYEPDSEYGYLSNWYMSDFMYAGRKYHSMEQYMMFQKALTFGDLEIADKIMASTDLPEIKKLGRSVAHYNDVLWKTIRVQIMRRGIRAKFQQNPELLYNLLGTGSALMAECAPRDLVWGIGLDIEDARSGDPKEWKGRNLLGRTLMRVREDLRAWCSVAGASVTQYVDAVDLRTPQPIRVSRRQDSGKADRIRRELEEAAGAEALDPDVMNDSADGAEADDGVMGSHGLGARDNASETSVWNMHIYEACMLPYLSEIVATWMEEVFFNLRRSRSYEDLGVSNYTFEELEWMLRSGQSAGLPVAGFFEMKQDIFDLMRYRGGLRNPASLLAQVESMTDGFHETIPSTDTEVPEETSDNADESFSQYEETHIIVDFASGARNRLVGTQDPGRTSAPETYLGAGARAAEASADAQEEATTSFESGIGAGVRADDMWNTIRDMENGTDDTAAQSIGREPEPAAAEEEPAPESAETVAESVPYEIVTGTMPDEVVIELEREEEEFSEETAFTPAEPAAAEPETIEFTAVEPAAEETAEPATEFTAEAAEPAEEVAGEAETQAEEPVPESAEAEPVTEAAEIEVAEPAAEEAENATAEEPAKAEEPAPAEKPWYAQYVKPAKEAEEVAEEAAEEEPEEPKAAAAATEEKTVSAEAEDYDGDGEPDEDYEFDEESDEDEYDEDESDEDEDEDEEDEEEEDEEYPEPPQPKTQFIPHTEPAAQRPLTYHDEIRSEIVIRHGNIAAVDCDCVVNATNTTLLGGNGIDNSIMKAAGPELLRECAALKGCDVGRAKISGGYRLKAQFVIHTVGPRYSGDETDPVYLTMCYENCLNLAMKYDIHSIAFPPISTGYYGYPLREATLVASRTVQGWMRRHPEYGIKVIFVSADDRTFAMYKDVFK